LLAAPAQTRTATLTALITAALVLLATLRLHQELLSSACGWLVICGLPLPGTAGMDR
jgi:hypothetical protein